MCGVQGTLRPLSSGLDVRHRAAGSLGHWEGWSGRVAISATALLALVLVLAFAPTLAWLGLACCMVLGS